ncbi:MAG TPA: hypothetical protein PLD82_02255 [Spirochaetota bacterium]|nr:hypothetical protein [Spirochaetota bacterium]
MKKFFMAGVLLVLVGVAGCSKSAGGDDANAYISEMIPLLIVKTGLDNAFSERFEKAVNGQAVVSIYSQYMATNQSLGQLVTGIQDKYKGVTREAFMAAYSNRKAEMSDVEMKNEMATMRLQVAFLSNQHRDSVEVKKLFSDLSNQAYAQMQQQPPTVQ